MAFSDSHSELRSSIGEWLARDDVDGNDQITADLIAVTEAELNRVLRLTHMEQRYTATITGGDRYLDIPSDMLEAKTLHLLTSPIRELDYRTPFQMNVEYQSTSITGPPEVYTIIGREFKFGPVPDADYTIELAYYQKVTPMSSTNSSNIFLEQVPDILLWGCLKNAEPYLVNDARIAVWERKFNEQIAAQVLKDKELRYSGSSLAMRPA